MRHHRTIMAGAAAAALLAGSAHAQEIVLRSADTHADGYPTVEAVKHMGELLAERSDGRITVEVFPARQLGEESDTIEQTRFGVIDMNRVNLAPLNNLVPETSVPGLPYVFRSIDHMRAVMDGEIGQEILDALEPHDLIGLAFYDSGARSFYNSEKPIVTPADLEGMKIRVQQSDLFVAMMDALGANATPMPFGEVYSALQTGVVDGAENNWPSYESTGHYQVAEYYSLDEHSMSPEVLVMSKATWDGLSPEDQEMIRQAARDSVPYMRELWDAREAEARRVVEEAGSRINEVDKQAFIDAMAPVYEQFVTDPALQDMVDRIRAVEAM
jgi:tripartite ATP-independent transporter DctP family solute receptor